MFSTWMYCQTSISVQFESGNTRMLSPGRSLPLSRFHSSGPLALRIPLAVGVADREDALLRARPFLVAPRAAEWPRRSCPPASPSSSALVFSRPQQRCVPTLNGCVPSPIASSFVWTISRAPTALAISVAELDHLAELVGGVDVEQRERDRARVERLLRQPQQDRRVLADRIEHHRPLELGHHLAHDVDAFGLQGAQMVQLAGPGCGGRFR